MPVAPPRAEQESGLEIELPIDEAEQRGRILVVHVASRHATAIAEALAARLRAQGFAVETGHVRAGPMPPPQDYDLVVLGSPMKFGYESDLIARYIEQHRDGLAELPSALFTVSRSGDHDPLVFIERCVGAVAWRPTLTAAFAGEEPGHSGVLSALVHRIRRSLRSHDDNLRTSALAIERFADAIAAELVSPGGIQSARTGRWP